MSSKGGVTITVKAGGANLQVELNKEEAARLQGRHLENPIPVLSADEWRKEKRLRKQLEAAVEQDEAKNRGNSAFRSTFRRKFRAKRKADQAPPILVEDEERHASQAKEEC